jgi:hypothetical protein
MPSWRSGSPNSRGTESRYCVHCEITVGSLRELSRRVSRILTNTRFLCWLRRMVVALSVLFCRNPRPVSFTLVVRKGRSHRRWPAQSCKSHPGVRYRTTTVS